MPVSAAPSAKVLANRAAAIVMNQAALDAAGLGIADGLFALGTQIIADASSRAPKDAAEAAKRGVPMMADTGHCAVWAMGKLVAGDSSLAASSQKPRGLKVPADQMVLVMWFSSPLAHFAEHGTVKEAPRPFFLPAVNAGVPGTGKYVLPAMAARIAGGAARAMVTASGGSAKAGNVAAAKARKAAWNQALK
jgi:hypothetical protein